MNADPTSSLQFYQLSNDIFDESSNQKIDKKTIIMDEQKLEKNISSGFNQKSIIKDRKKRKYVKRKPKQLICVENIASRVKNSEKIILCSGLSITSDGTVRFSFPLDQVIFGLSNQRVENITYYKDSQIVLLSALSSQNTHITSIKDALQFISQTPCERYLEVTNALRYFNLRKEDIFSKVYKTLPDYSPKNINERLLLEDEITDNIDSCLESTIAYLKQQENQIFSFSICKINLENQDVERIKSGYSKCFLDLIGVDVDNFLSIQLRHQQIELVEDKGEILTQSIQGLNHKFLSDDQLQLSFKITTFDGFPLTLHSKKQNYQQKFELKSVNKCIYEYVLCITTMDVDLYDLQNLILYRDRLLNNKLSFEEYLKKELSYFFEDVEYSVHSEGFIQKYYQENIKVLFEIQESQKKESQKLCGYRFINPVVIQPC